MCVFIEYQCFYFNLNVSAVYSKIKYVYEDNLLCHTLICFKYNVISLKVFFVYNVVMYIKPLLP
jgi:hypothetical protein